MRAESGETSLQTLLALYLELPLSELLSLSGGKRRHLPFELKPSGQIPKFVGGQRRDSALLEPLLLFGGFDRVGMRRM
jgi:hypothetical protein